jgi:hypothetical protein
VAQPSGKPAATKALGPTVSEPPRQPPTLRLGLSRVARDSVIYMKKCL